MNNQNIFSPIEIVAHFALSSLITAGNLGSFYGLPHYSAEFSTHQGEKEHAAVLEDILLYSKSRVAPLLSQIGADVEQASAADVMLSIILSHIPEDARKSLYQDITQNIPTYASLVSESIGYKVGYYVYYGIRDAYMDAAVAEGTDRVAKRIRNMISGEIRSDIRSGIRDELLSLFGSRTNLGSHYESVLRGVDDLVNLLMGDSASGAPDVSLGLESGELIHFVTEGPGRERARSLAAHSRDFLVHGMHDITPDAVIKHVAERGSAEEVKRLIHSAFWDASLSRQQELLEIAEKSARLYSEHPDVPFLFILAENLGRTVPSLSSNLHKSLGIDVYKQEVEHSRYIFDSIVDLYLDEFRNLPIRDQMPPLYMPSTVYSYIESRKSPLLGTVVRSYDLSKANKEVVHEAEVVREQNKVSRQSKSTRESKVARKSKGLPITTDVTSVSDVVTSTPSAKEASSTATQSVRLPPPKQYSFAPEFLTSSAAERYKEPTVTGSLGKPADVSRNVKSYTPGPVLPHHVSSIPFVDASVDIQEGVYLEDLPLFVQTRIESLQVGKIVELGLPEGLTAETFVSSPLFEKLSTYTLFEDYVSRYFRDIADIELEEDVNPEYLSLEDLGLIDKDFTLADLLKVYPERTNRMLEDLRQNPAFLRTYIVGDPERYIRGDPELLRYLSWKAEDAYMKLVHHASVTEEGIIRSLYGVAQFVNDRDSDPGVVESERLEWKLAKGQPTSNQTYSRPVKDRLESNIPGTIIRNVKRDAGYMYVSIRGEGVYAELPFSMDESMENIRLTVRGSLDEILDQENKDIALEAISRLEERIQATLRDEYGGLYHRAKLYDVRPFVEDIGRLKNVLSQHGITPAEPLKLSLSESVREVLPGSSGLGEERPMSGLRRWFSVLDDVYVRHGDVIYRVSEVELTDRAYNDLLNLLMEPALSGQVVKEVDLPTFNELVSHKMVRNVRLSMVGISDEDLELLRHARFRIASDDTPGDFAKLFKVGVALVAHQDLVDALQAHFNKTSTSGTESGAKGVEKGAIVKALDVTRSHTRRRLVVDPYDYVIKKGQSKSRSSYQVHPIVQKVHRLVSEADATAASSASSIRQSAAEEALQVIASTAPSEVADTSIIANQHRLLLWLSTKLPEGVPDIRSYQDLNKLLEADTSLSREDVQSLADAFDQLTRSVRGVLESANGKKLEPSELNDVAQEFVGRVLSFHLRDVQEALGERSKDIVHIMSYITPETVSPSHPIAYLEILPERLNLAESLLQLAFSEGVPSTTGEIEKAADAYYRSLRRVASTVPTRSHSIFQSKEIKLTDIGSRLEEQGVDREDIEEAKEAVLTKAAENASQDPAEAVIAAEAASEKEAYHLGQWLGAWIADPSLPLVGKGRYTEADKLTNLIYKNWNVVSLSLGYENLGIRNLRQLATARREMVERVAASLQETGYMLSNEVTRQLTSALGSEEAAVNALNLVLGNLYSDLNDTRILSDMITYDLTKHLFSDNPKSVAVRAISAHLKNPSRKTLTKEEQHYVKGIVDAIQTVGSALNDSPINFGAIDISKLGAAYEAFERNDLLPVYHGKPALPVDIEIPGVGTVQTYLAEVDIGGQPTFAIHYRGSWVPIENRGAGIEVPIGETARISDREVARYNLRAEAVVTGDIEPSLSIATTKAGEVVVRGSDLEKKVIESIRSGQGRVLALDIETAIDPLRTPITVGLVEASGKDANVLMHEGVFAQSSKSEVQAAERIRRGFERGQQLSSMPDISSFYPSHLFDNVEDILQGVGTVEEAHLHRLSMISRLLDILESEQNRDLAILIENRAFDLNALIGYLNSLMNNREVMQQYKRSDILQLIERLRRLSERVVDPQLVLASLGERHARPGIKRSLSVEARLRGMIEDVAPGSTSTISQLETHTSAADAYHSFLTLSHRLEQIDVPRVESSISEIQKGRLLYGLSGYHVPEVHPPLDSFVERNVNTPGGRLFRIEDIGVAASGSEAPGVHYIQLSELTPQGEEREWIIQASSASRLEDILNRHFMLVDEKVMKARGVPVADRTEAEKVARTWTRHVMEDRARRKLRTAMGIHYPDGSELDTIAGDLLHLGTEAQQIRGAFRTLRRALGMTQDLGGATYFEHLMYLSAGNGSNVPEAAIDKAFEFFSRVSFREEDIKRVTERVKTRHEADFHLIVRNVLEHGVRPSPNPEQVDPILYEFLLDIMYARSYLTDPVIQEQYRKVGQFLTRNDIQPIVGAYRDITAHAFGLRGRDIPPEMLYRHWRELGEIVAEAQQSMMRRIDPMNIPVHDIGVAVESLGTRGRMSRNIIPLLDQSAAQAAIEYSVLNEMRNMSRDELYSELMRIWSPTSSDPARTEQMARLWASELAGRDVSQGLPSILQPDSKEFRQVVEGIFHSRIAPRSFGEGTSVSVNDVIRLSNMLSNLRRSGVVDEGQLRKVLANFAWLPENTRERLVNQLTSGLELIDEFTLPKLDTSRVEGRAGLVTSDLVYTSLHTNRSRFDPSALFGSHLEEYKRIRKLLGLNLTSLVDDLSAIEKLSSELDLSPAAMLAWSSRLSDRAFAEGSAYEKVLDLIADELSLSRESVVSQIGEKAFQLSNLIKVGYPLTSGAPISGWVEPPSPQVMEEAAQAVKSMVHNNQGSLYAILGLSVAGVAGAILFGMMDESRQREESERRGAEVQPRRQAATRRHESSTSSEDTDEEYTIRGGKLSDQSIDRIRGVVSGGRRRRERSSHLSSRLHRFGQTDIRRLARKLIGVE